MFGNANENLAVRKNSPIKNLKLKNFRNIKNLELDFNNQVTVFLGKNGQGKTNIAESIYFLSKAKSFRTNKIFHLIQENQSTATLKVNFENEDLNYELNCVLENEKKSFLLNEKKTTPIQIFKKLPVIFFSPESLSSIKEGPEYRRNLIDETLFLENHSHLDTYFEFKKALVTRNKLLKDIQTKKVERRDGLNILDSLNESYATFAVELSRLRKNLIAGLLPMFENCFKDLSFHQNVEIGVECGEIIFDKENMLKELNNAMGKELSLGYTQVGPHKHDIKFLYNGKDSRFFSSQGQQRTLILAFKFSQIMYHKEVYGYYPTLILDDVFSELDREKRKYLINFLKQSEVQTFLTTTDFESLGANELDAFVFQIEEGVVINQTS